MNPANLLRENSLKRGIASGREAGGLILAMKREAFLETIRKLKESVQTANAMIRPL